MEVKKYNAWKSKSNGDPIEGTDRIFNGVSKRSVIKHLCKDGTIWHVSII